MKRSLFLLLTTLFLHTMLVAQELKVTGTVTDPGGEPLIGVNVVEKGTTNGTITDIDGKYEITVPLNATLVFSFIGLETMEVPVEGNSTVSVKLEEGAVVMDELVVTALGITQAKKSVGYSTQTVDTEELTDVNAQNFGSLLTGRVAGLAVDNPTGIFQSPSFSLRGRKPLIVVDNIPMETDFFDLSQNDIEDITVLKGTTASALYGSRGKDGAILITTKDAKKDGLVVTLSNSTMFTAGYTVFPETQTEYGNGSLGKYEFWDGKDGGISDGDMIWGPKFSDNLEIPQWNSPIYDNVTGETIPWWGDVSGTKYDDRSRYSRVPIPWKYHNNLDDFLETGYVTTTDFSIAYKSERTQYRFSGNYSDQKGQVPNTSLKRGGATFTSTFQLGNSVTVDGKLAYNKVYSPNYPRYGYGPRNHMYTILIWMGDDVNGQDLAAHHYIPGQEGYRQANFNYAWYNNVYFAAHELNQKYDKDVINGQISLKWDITRDLSLKGRMSAIKNDRFEDRASPKSYLNYGDPREGDYKTWNTDWVTYDNDILLSYKKQLTSALNLTLNAGGASYFRRYQQEYNATDGLIVPWVYSLNNTEGNVKGSTYYETRSIRSAYATMNVDVLDAFFFTFSGRNDWSSTLPESNQSYFYPSVSLSTMVSNLIGMPDVVDYLKVYGSWAEVSSDLNPYQISAYYNNAGSFAGNTMLTYPGGLINPNIQPQKSTSFELGLSTAAFTNRIHFDFTYYNIVDENQIIDLPVSQASGFNSRKVNGNEYTTNGFEVMLGATPVKSGNFRWDASFNWDKRIQRLTEIYGDQERFGNLTIDERTDSYYTTVWLRSPDGQVILNANSGLPTRDPFPRKVGYLNPDWRFGFQNTFTYGNFSLDIDVDGLVGGIFWSRTLEKMWWGGKHPNSTTYRDAEYAAGEPVYVPDGVNVVSGEVVYDIYGNITSDTRVFEDHTTPVNWQTWNQNYPYRARVTSEMDEEFANTVERDFVKLRRMSLTYDASDLININGLSGMEITAFGYNLWMWKKAPVVDPDFGHDNDLQDPSARYLGMSLRFTF